MTVPRGGPARCRWGGHLAVGSITREGLENVLAISGSSARGRGQLVVFTT